MSWSNTCTTCSVPWRITVSIRHEYGQRRVYPYCKYAKAFARIAGTSTLTEQTLSIIKQLNIEIETEQVEWV